jgi:hypothetical protein
VLVVTRFRIPEADGASFRADLLAVHDLLATFPGYEDGRVGRNLDDPELWVLTTTWADVGSYRRALGSYDVKLHLPTLGRAVDEPSAYESAEPGADLNTRSTRSLS